MRIAFVLFSVLLVEAPREGDVLRVPADHATIQAAIDAAKDGDTVLVAPGVYREALRLRKKTITLASRFLETKDGKDVEATVLEPRKKGKGAVIEVDKSVGPETRIIGFTIRNGDDGIMCEGNIQILNNRFTNNKDAIDYEGGGGVCRGNEFFKNRDDGVDLDGACDVVVEGNVIRDNRDDGIEVRFHEYSGPTLKIVIRRNIITGNGEDGIQLIDYPDRSDREFRIERNVIAQNAMAGVGCMSNGNTREDYEAADIPEPIVLVHNTFVGNKYGITGGDNMLVLNNVFVETDEIALKKVDGKSVVAHNLFWKNGTDIEGSNVEEGTVLKKDPRLGEGYRPGAESGCIDAGRATFMWKGKEIVAAAEGSFTGERPDLGSYERR